MRHHPDGRTSGVMKLKCLSTIHLISCLTILLHHPDLVSCVPQFHFQPNDHRNVRVPVPASFQSSRSSGIPFAAPAAAAAPASRSQSRINRFPVPESWQLDDNSARSPFLLSPASSSPSLAAASQSHRQSVQEGSNCGYGSCHATNPNSLNIHIVCHTHLDTGWVETYDEYYHRYVKIIYDSVVSTLSERHDRKFIVVEVSFFSRWFNDQDDVMRKRVHWLVESGQLEFINGGWSMNDEAASHYQEIIDQLSYGMKWLNETFGSCALPKIGWQIDPFGHSREQASIFSQMGFDGLFLGRVDYQDKQLREKERTLEMIWKSSPSLGSKADMFTGILPNVYWPPTGFCFDINCWDEPLHENNIRAKAMDFIAHARKQALSYATNHTIITMGMDFYFRDAKKWYHNLDKLIQAVNELEPVEHVRIFYSTPACYLKSLHESRRRWPTKLDDFFPYADNFNTYWTGYFTSRPSLKYHIRYANNILQAVKQLHALIISPEEAASRHMFSRMPNRKIQKLQEALGITQHHDAVTGTCKQAVANDYAQMLMEGIRSGEEAIVEAYDRLWIKEGFIPITSSLSFCNRMNASVCDVTQSLTGDSDAVVIVYNPIAHQVKHYVRLPVSSSSGFRIRDAFGAIVSSQIVPNQEAVTRLPERLAQGSAAGTRPSLDLVFRVMLPPLGFTSVAIDRPGDPAAEANQNQRSMIRDGNSYRQQDEVVITNGRLSAMFDRETGLLDSIITKDGRRLAMRQNFLTYDAEGKKMGEKPSGAYAFNPTSSRPTPAASKVTIRVIKGPLVEEVHQTFNPWISQVIRIYQHVDYIEFDWVVGPIPIDNWFFDPGQEVVSRFESDLVTNGTFFTDANGRETLRRVRHHRPTWELDTTERVASNYYPVTSWIFVRDYDRDLQVTLLPDRSEGGSSLEDGVLELMVHRRLTMDDGFGMDEALNEPGEDGRGLVVRGKHRLIVADIQESVRQMRMMSKSQNLRPILSFRKRDLNPSASRTYRSLSNSQFIGLNQKLPANINLLTLEPWDKGRILIRLEHIFEVNEDSKYSRPRRISVRDLFTTLIVEDVHEMSLAGNREKVVMERSRLKWFPDFDPYANYTNVLTQVDDEVEGQEGSASTRSEAAAAGDKFSFLLYPMDIKTLLLTVRERTGCEFSGNANDRRSSRLRTPNC